MSPSGSGFSFPTHVFKNNFSWFIKLGWWLKGLIIMCTWPIVVGIIIWFGFKNIKVRNYALAGFLGLVFVLSIISSAISNMSKDNGKKENVAGVIERKNELVPTAKQESQQTIEIKSDEPVQTEKPSVDNVVPVIPSQNPPDTIVTTMPDPVTKKTDITTTPSTVTNEGKQIITTPQIKPPASPSVPAEKPAQTNGFIAGTCTELRKRGLGNWPRGDVNYSKKRDRDNDGIACELD
jgi:hypothetical protein